MSETTQGRAAAKLAVFHPREDAAGAVDILQQVCYQGQVPEFVEEEITRLYNNLFSSLAHFRAYGGLPTETSTYVAADQRGIRAIFLFRRERGRVTVLNEGMRLQQEDIRTFSRYIFSEYEGVQCIVFNAVQAHYGQLTQLTLPHQVFECTAQVVLPLPASEEAYLDSLGKNMRRNIKRYLRKLSTDFPSFEHWVCSGAAAREQDLHRLIELSRTRMNSLNKTFTLDPEVSSIVELAKTSGLVGLARIDGKVCGGILGYQVGNTFFAKVIGHDPRYSDYSLGILCCYLMIRACIERGCTEFNFMWNEYEYKRALGGVREGLQRVVIYRSRAGFLRQLDTVFDTAYAGWRYRAVRWMEQTQQPQQPSSLPAGLLLRAVRWLRDARRGRSLRTRKPAG